MSGWLIFFDEGLGGGNYKIDTLILFSEVAPENLRNYPFCDSGLSCHVQTCTVSKNKNKFLRIVTERKYLTLNDSAPTQPIRETSDHERHWR